MKLNVGSRGERGEVWTAATQCTRRSGIALGGRGIQAATFRRSDVFDAGVPFFASTQYVCGSWSYYVLYIHSTSTYIRRPPNGGGRYATGSWTGGGDAGTVHVPVFGISRALAGGQPRQPAAGALAGLNFLVVYFVGRGTGLDLHWRVEVGTVPR